jgi:uncharacterized protein YcfJ
MKQLLIAATVVLSLLAPPMVFAAQETKRVCVEQINQKTKKPKQVCKQVKIHKKLEGTPVPSKKGK